ncbi:hypothetical protein [Streptomyces sp. NBC_00197]|uniref:hypothetical protein n=1 Tax=Streptomyces sp. NBC_00197 TaxID=2975676 RepID=UPI003247F9A4
MGKRGRRKAREAGEQKPKVKSRLGQTGPYMVCRECKNPLTLYSLVDRENEFDEEKIVYIHSLEYISPWGEVLVNDEDDYGHEAVPVEGDPVSAETTCDFCHSPDSRWVFVPRKTIRMADPLNPGVALDYSSPWNCCDGCKQAVKSKSVTRMLDLAMTSEYSANSTRPEEVKSLLRMQLREMYTKYLSSNPAGPYELKIPPKPKPAGSPGSRKGM